MRGSHHLAIGMGVGFLIAMNGEMDLANTVTLVGMGGVAGLIPDLDLNGKLSRKISIPVGLIYSILTLIGFILISYSIWRGVGYERWIGVGIGLGLMVIPKIIIKQKTMLLVTGILVTLVGINLGEIWMILIGIYIGIASHLPHRSYTHSLIGLSFFGVIAYYLELSLGINNILLVCVLGYVSHLIADMKFIPHNRKGVKWFQPFFNKEF